MPRAVPPVVHRPTWVICELLATLASDPQRWWPLEQLVTAASCSPEMARGVLEQLEVWAWTRSAAALGHPDAWMLGAGLADEAAAYFAGTAHEADQLGGLAHEVIHGRPSLRGEVAIPEGAMLPRQALHKATHLVMAIMRAALQQAGPVRAKTCTVLVDEHLSPHPHTLAQVIEQLIEHDWLLQVLIPGEEREPIDLVRAGPALPRMGWEWMHARLRAKDWSQMRMERAFTDAEAAQLLLQAEQRAAGGAR